MENTSLRHYAVVRFKSLLISEQPILELALEKEIIPLCKSSNSRHIYTFEAYSEESLTDFLDVLAKKGYLFSARQYSK